MEKAGDYLKGWLLRYLKNRDLMLRNIVKLEEKEDGIFVELKDKTQTFLIRPFLKELNDADLKDGNVLVVYNTVENFDVVVKNWKRLVDIGRWFGFYFVNPFSRLDKKWIIYPGTHHFVADQASLKTGLRAMFETVEAITEEEVNRILK